VLPPGLGVSLNDREDPSEDRLGGVGEATVDRLLAEQKRYYRERAPEYDDWWFRRGGVPTREFDVCFFGFWHSHVPAQRFEAFWQLVGRALRPGGRVFLVDNARLGD
jgi:SAM-dependent methyltransferase